MLRLEIGGRAFHLETAAVSCLRYRVAYGESVPVALAACRDARALEGALLRLVHIMILPAERPGLLEFAALARRDPGFLEKAIQAQDALLAEDPAHTYPEDPDGAPFDDYRFLALLCALGVDASLVHELPLFHLFALADEVGKGKGAGQGYHEMSTEEMAQLYPR